MTYINVPYVVEDMPEEVALELLHAIKKKFKWNMVIFTKDDIRDSLDEHFYEVTDENIELVHNDPSWDLVATTSTLEGIDTLGYIVREIMTSKEANEG